MVLWRESLQKLKCLGRHFMTNQTFKDMMTAIDGLILYIIDCVKYEAEIVPWFLSSDSLEQLFSWLRVGRYEGRRTNLDYLTVVQGTGKSNQNYAMDGEGLHLLEPTIAHTRGQRLLSQPPDDEIIIYTGKDIGLAEVRIALGTGSELGQEKFANHTSFAPVNTPVSVTRGRGNNEDETEDVSDDGEDTDKLEFDFEDGMFEFGSRYHINTAVSKFLNDGRTSMPAMSRFRRLTLSSSNNLTLDRRCDPIKEECEIVEVGARGEFRVKLKSPAREVIIEGVVIFLSDCASEDRAADRSSVSFRPLNIVCAAHNNIV